MSNTEQQKTYDADSLELQLDNAKRKNQYTKNKSPNKQSSGGPENQRYVSVHSQSPPFNDIWFRPETGRRNSNVTVKSNEKFTETEITWSENTDRLI